MRKKKIRTKDYGVKSCEELENQCDICKKKYKKGNLLNIFNKEKINCIRVLSKSKPYQKWYSFYLCDKCYKRVLHIIIGLMMDDFTDEGYRLYGYRNAW